MNDKDYEKKDDHLDENLQQLEEQYVKAKYKLEEAVRLKQIKESPIDHLFNVLFATITFEKLSTKDCLEIIQELISRFKELNILDSNYHNTSKFVLLVKKRFNEKRKEISEHRDDLTGLQMAFLELEKIINKSISDSNNEEK